MAILVNRGDIIQVSEKIYKAADEAEIRKKARGNL